MKARLKAGMKHRVVGAVGAVGELVEGPLDVDISQEEFASFGDKFEMVGKAKSKTAALTQDEDPVEALIQFAVDELGLDDPEDLALVSDKEIQAVKGIGKKSVEAIRVKYPFEG